MEKNLIRFPYPHVPIFMIFPVSRFGVPRGNKGDILNCRGNMPSLRRGGLPGSFNLPRGLRMSPLPTRMSPLPTFISVLPRDLPRAS